MKRKNQRYTRCGCGIKSCMIRNGDHEAGSRGCVMHQFGEGVPDWTPDPVEVPEERPDKARDQERRAERRAKSLGWL